MRASCEDLRKQVGDEIFFAFLKDYYTQYEGRRATGADFFRVLHETHLGRYHRVVTAIFQEYILVCQLQDERPRQATSFRRLLRLRRHDMRKPL